MKKTPEKVVPDAGDVTNGMNMRDIRFCSATILFSVSSGRWISKALETILTNLMLMLEALPGDGVSAGTVAGSAS